MARVVSCLLYVNENGFLPETELEVFDLRPTETTCHKQGKNDFAFVAVKACKAHGPDDFDLFISGDDFSGQGRWRGGILVNHCGRIVAKC